MAVAANKSDMYEYEEVTEEQGMAFAKQYNAIFQTTSAKESNGSIDLLFKNIGKKFLHPDIENTSNLTKDELKKRGQKLEEERIDENNKKRCCWQIMKDLNKYTRYFIIIYWLILIIRINKNEIKKFYSFKKFKVFKFNN